MKKKKKKKEKEREKEEKEEKEEEDEEEKEKEAKADKIFPWHGGSWQAHRRLTLACFFTGTIRYSQFFSHHSHANQSNGFINSPQILFH